MVSFYAVLRDQLNKILSEGFHPDITFDTPAEARQHIVTFPGSPWSGREFNKKDLDSIVILKISGDPNDYVDPKNILEYKGKIASPVMTIPILLASSPHTKIGISLPDLVRETNQFSAKYKGGCVAKLLDSNPKALFLQYNVKCNKKESDPTGHDVRIQFDVTKVEQSQKAKDLDIRVTCSCVAPDTKVLMADGTEKPINQIKVGEYVITHKGRARKVTHVLSRPAKENEQAWEIKVEGYRDPLVVSDDHPLAVVRGNTECACGCGTPLKHTYNSNTHSGKTRKPWKRCFSPGHGKRRSIISDSGGVAFWKTIPETIPQELLYFPKIEWVGNEPVNTDLATLTGYYLAEGSLQKTVAKKPEMSKTAAKVQINGTTTYLYGVSFALHQEERETLAADIIKRVKNLYPNAGVILRNARVSRGMTVEVRCADLAEKLFYLVGEGSLTKKLSTTVLGWNKEAMLDLCSAYILGDGGIKEGRQDVSSSSPDLASQISTFLYSIGVWHNISFEDRPKIGERIYRINWDYRKYSIIIEKIKGRLREKQLNTIKNNSYLSRKKDNHNWKDGFVRVLRDKKIVPSPGMFYDLTVDEDESFIANRVLVHNCPAFLWYGAQWNLHRRDGLLGQPRPKLVAPTKRLDLRANYILCKHLHTSLERVLPSVQHNITNILREREVRKNKNKEEQIPLRLKEKQDEMKRKKELEKIHKIKDKDTREEALKVFEKEEEDRRLHEQQLLNQGKTPGNIEEEPLPEEITEESEDLVELQDKLKQEEEKVEEAHEEGLPHVHKGLPYDIEPEEEEEDHIIRKFESRKIRVGDTVRWCLSPGEPISKYTGKVVEIVKDYTDHNGYRFKYGAKVDWNLSGHDGRGGDYIYTMINQIEQLVLVPDIESLGQGRLRFSNGKKLRVGDKVWRSSEISRVMGMGEVCHIYRQDGVVLYDVIWELHPSDIFKGYTRDKLIPVSNLESQGQKRLFSSNSLLRKKFKVGDAVYYVSVEEIFQDMIGTVLSVDKKGNLKIRWRNIALDSDCSPYTSTYHPWEVALAPKIEAHGQQRLFSSKKLGVGDKVWHSWQDNGLGEIKQVYVTTDGYTYYDVTWEKNPESPFMYFHSELTPASKVEAKGQQRLFSSKKKYKLGDKVFRADWDEDNPKGPIMGEITRVYEARSWRDEEIQYRVRWEGITGEMVGYTWGDLVPASDLETKGQRRIKFGSKKLRVGDRFKVGDKVYFNYKDPEIISAMGVIEDIRDNERYQDQEAQVKWGDLDFPLWHSFKHLRLVPKKEQMGQIRLFSNTDKIWVEKIASRSGKNFKKGDIVRLNIKSDADIMGKIVGLGKKEGIFKVKWNPPVNVGPLSYSSSQLEHVSKKEQAGQMRLFGRKKFKVGDKVYLLTKEDGKEISTDLGMGEVTEVDVKLPDGFPPNLKVLRIKWDDRSLLCSVGYVVHANELEAQGQKRLFSSDSGWIEKISSLRSDYKKFSRFYELISNYYSHILPKEEINKLREEATKFTTSWCKDHMDLFNTSKKIVDQNTIEPHGIYWKTRLDDLGRVPDNETGTSLSILQDLIFDIKRYIVKETTGKDPLYGTTIELGEKVSSSSLRKGDKVLEQKGQTRLFSSGRLKAGDRVYYVMNLDTGEPDLNDTGTIVGMKEGLFDVVWDDGKFNGLFNSFFLSPMSEKESLGQQRLFSSKKFKVGDKVWFVGDDGSALKDILGEIIEYPDKSFDYPEEDKDKNLAKVRWGEKGNPEGYTGTYTLYRLVHANEVESAGQLNLFASPTKKFKVGDRVQSIIEPEDPQERLFSTKGDGKCM